MKKKSVSIRWLGLWEEKRKEKKTWTEMRFSLYTESPGTMLLVSRASSLDFAIKTPSCLCGIITALFPPLIPPRWLTPPRWLPPPRPRPRTPKPLPALFCALKAPPPRPPLPALFWALKAPRPWPAPRPNISVTNAEGKKKKSSSYVLIILKLWQWTNLCVG